MGGRGPRIRNLASNQGNFDFEEERLKEIIAQVQSQRAEHHQRTNPIAFRPCCCCGSYTIPLDSEYLTCSRCQWIDDPFQNNNPDNPNGRNSISLNDAKEAFKRWHRIIK
jgi:hypothetical protein